MARILEEIRRKTQKYPIKNASPAVVMPCAVGKPPLPDLGKYQITEIFTETSYSLRYKWKPLIELTSVPEGHYPIFSLSFLS